MPGFLFVRHNEPQSDENVIVHPRCWSLSLHVFCRFVFSCATEGPTGIWLWGEGVARRKSRTWEAAIVHLERWVWEPASAVLEALGVLPRWQSEGDRARAPAVCCRLAPRALSCLQRPAGWHLTQTEVPKGHLKAGPTGKGRALCPTDMVAADPCWACCPRGRGHSVSSGPGWGGGWTQGEQFQMGFPGRPATCVQKGAPASQLLGS